MTNLSSYQPVKILLPQRMVASIKACFYVVFEPGSFSCELTPDAFTLQITDNKWGDIGQVACIETHRGQTTLRFEPPRKITPNAVVPYKKLLQDECLGSRGKLADLLGQTEIVEATLVQALYEKRLERQQEFIIWLSNRLRIFGYRDLYPDDKSDNSSKIDEHFDFPIKGTPAQFSVMLRQFAQTLRAQADYQQLVCQILLPSSRKDAGSISPDANPVEVKLALGKSQISLHAHVLPSDGTLSGIYLNGDKKLWFLWDRIRDELEKFGWFSLPDIPEQSAPREAKPVSQPQEKLSPAEVWMSIPDIGANREILRLWHQGLTCEQIAARVGLTEKTVLNRINKLRKEFGIEIVPYRKSNFINKSKDRPT